MWIKSGKTNVVYCWAAEQDLHDSHLAGQIAAIDANRTSQKYNTTNDLRRG